MTPPLLSAAEDLESTFSLLKVKYYCVYFYGIMKSISMISGVD